VQSFLKAVVGGISSSRRQLSKDTFRKNIADLVLRNNPIFEGAGRTEQPTRARRGRYSAVFLEEKSILPQPGLQGIMK
jgi:hypothetical protein